MAVKRESKKITKVAEKDAIEVKNSSPKASGLNSIKKRLKQRNVLAILIVIVLAIAAFLLKGYFVAAMVNGEPISRFAVISELEKQGGSQTLSSLVNQALILQEARKKDVQVSEEEIDKSVKEIEDSLKTQGQSLDTALEMQGMTKEDLRTQLKLRLLVEKLLADKIKVTDKEVADYIEDNKDTFPTDMTEDDIKKNVTDQLKQQKLGAESQTWLQGLTENAQINYFVNY